MHTADADGDEGTDATVALAGLCWCGDWLYDERMEEEVCDTGRGTGGSRGSGSNEAERTATATMS